MSNIVTLSYPALIKKKKYQTPEYLHYGAGDVVLDYEDESVWNEDSGSSDDDAVNYKEGTQSVKGTAPAGGTLQIDIDTPIDAINDRNMWFWIYVPDASIMFLLGPSFIALGFFSRKKL